MLSLRSTRTPASKIWWRVLLWNITCKCLIVQTSYIMPSIHLVPMIHSHDSSSLCQLQLSVLHQLSVLQAEVGMRRYRHPCSFTLPLMVHQTAPHGSPNQKVATVLVSHNTTSPWHTSSLSKVYYSCRAYSPWAARVHLARGNVVWVQYKSFQNNWAHSGLILTTGTVGDFIHDLKPFLILCDCALSTM